MGGLRCDERKSFIKRMMLDAGWCQIVLFSLKEDISFNYEQLKRAVTAGNEYFIDIKRSYLTV